MVDSKNNLTLLGDESHFPLIEDHQIHRTGLFESALKSSLCRLAVTSSLAGLGARKLLGSSPKLSLISSLAVCALQLPFCWKKVLYEGTLGIEVLLKNLCGNQWYHVIIPSSESRGGLIFGAQPLKNFDHHYELIKFAILSLLEEHEFSSPTPWSDPVTPQDWEVQDDKIPRKWIITADFQPVSTAHLWEAVLWIEEQTQKGISVYVHCKSGRSRSATAVLAYLLYRMKIAGDMEGIPEIDIEKVVSLVRAIRPGIILLDHDHTALKQFYHSLLEYRSA